MRGWIRRWLDRHQHPASQILHAIGIPMLPAAGILAGIQLADGAWSLWWRPVALVAGSYVLQWIGHRIEGNDMGEIILVRRWLGRPDVAIAPRSVQSSGRKPGDKSVGSRLRL